jgi:divalent metal cation (Fe/Co/Zn/Cd) transporter
MNSEIIVSNSFALIIFFGAILFIGKSIYDLVKSKQLSSREKTYLAFLIAIIPVYGSLMFYMYERNNRNSGRFLTNQ